MIQHQPDLLNDILQVNTRKRKELLPIWMKIFMWIFLVFSAIVPFVLILGLLGKTATLAIYGLETEEPFSIIGLLITFVFLLKGITALGMVLQKAWAIKAGLVDAILGMAICVFCMAFPIMNPAYKFSFRLELIVLIPYLIKLLKIKREWEQEPAV